jgi:hypothetical protein
LRKQRRFCFFGMPVLSGAANLSPVLEKAVRRDRMRVHPEAQQAAGVGSFVRWQHEWVSHPGFNRPPNKSISS